MRKAHIFIVALTQKSNKPVTTFKELVKRELKKAVMLRHLLGIQEELTNKGIKELR